MTGVRQAGERVEHLLASLRSAPAASGAAEELVGLLVGLYGDGLARVMAVLAAGGDAGAQLMTALTEDPLVESLLLLHDLHPLDVDARVQRALDRVRPYLGSHAGGVRYLPVAGLSPGASEVADREAGWVTLRRRPSPAPADVEAVLISQAQDGIECFLIPVDACYELAGRMRLHWRGFDGGTQARQNLAEFLDDVRTRSRPLPQAEPASQGGRA